MGGWSGIWMGLVGVALLAGCQGPTQAAPAPLAAGRTAAAQAHLALGGYALAATISRYTSADVHHVTLTLLKATGGSYAATGATTSVLAASLGGAIALGQLKLDTAYRVRVDAYSAATESSATLISDPAASVTDFTTPATTTTAGVTSVDDATLDLGALKLVLVDKTYVANAAWTLSLSNTLKTKVSTVKVTLYAGTTALTQKTYAVAEVNASQVFPLTNLKMATTYKLQADGYDANGVLKSKVANSTVSFTTPTLSNGQISDAVGTKTLPCK